MPGACGGLKQVLDPLEQKLQTVVSSHCAVLTAEPSQVCFEGRNSMMKQV